MKNKPIISIDFDETLEYQFMQEFAKQLIENDVEVHILTTRYDNENAKIYYNRDHINEDIYEIAKNLNIEKIFFTNMVDKWTFLKDKPEYVIHIDNEFSECKTITKHTNTIGICWFNSGSWKHKVSRVLKNKFQIILTKKN